MLERSRARSWALQVLYVWESRGITTPLDTLDQFERERRIRPTVRPYLRRLVELVEIHRDTLDAEIAQGLTNWRLERLSAIDRNILRLATAELRHAPDVPPKVAVKEALRLADRYGTAESPRFVNGVLDALMRAGNQENGGAES
ncbi:MAG: transcription antitermination factor NusB [Gemmatimonadota bacterium]